MSASSSASSSSSSTQTAQGAPASQAGQGAQRRMIIAKMFLVNFKSYAGRIEVGPFHKSFTSVVGPNGSGKSNVIDAILFVFGFRANKMRQAKVSDLIHFSAKFQKLQECQVEVHFVDIWDLPDNDSFEVIPGTELVVTRTANKANQSNYFVNGKKSNYTDVTSMLKDRGIDLTHNRFLILQGEVELISQMKPKALTEHEDGLLEYLEDIIGTSQLKEPIQTKSKALDELTEKRAEKLNRVKIVEKEKDSLEAKKGEAEQYLIQENDLTRNQALMYQRFYFDAENNVKVAKARVDEASAKMEEHNKVKSKLQKDMSQHETEHNKIAKDYETVGKEVKKSKAEFGAFEREQIKLQENIKHKADQEKKAKKAIEKERLKESEQKHLAKSNESDIAKISKEVEAQTKQRDHEEQELETMRDSLKGETQVIQVQVEAKQKELAPTLERRTKIQTAIDVAQAEVELLEKRVNAVANATKTIQAQIEAAKTSAEQQVGHQKDLSAQLSALKKEQGKLEVQLKALKEKEPGLVSAWKEAREKADEAKSGLDASASSNNVLKQLKQQNDSGRIRGIYGRLGDLGAIDAKYDVAVTTACPQLDNIVVDTTETGQKCVEFLRKNNLGRCTFLIMDKVAQARDVVDTPENVPRLFDLIKPKDPKFRNVFYNAIRDTLVATDMAQANRVAYGSTRFRVVTLDGKVIDVSGTMSGGGNHVSRGGMSAKLKQTDVTEQDVKKLENERDRLSIEVKQCQEEIRTSASRLKELVTDIQNTELSLTKIDMDIQASKAQIDSLNQQMADVKTTLKPNPADVNRLAEIEKTVLAPKRQELDGLLPVITKAESEIHQLKEKMMEVGGVRMKAKKFKVDSLNESIDAANNRIVQAQVNQKTAQKAAAKAAEAIVSLEEEIVQIADELKTLQASLEEKLVSANEVKKKYSAAERVLEDMASKVEETKKLFDASKEALQKIRGVEVDISAQLEEDSKALEENKRKMTHWKGKFDALKLEPLPFVDAPEEPIKVLSVQEASALDLDKLKATIAVLEEKLRSNKPNLAVLEQYQAIEQDYLAKVTDLNTVTSERDKLRQEYDDLRKRRLEDFMGGFTQITQKLKEMYQMITLGGNAELELVDSLDPFSEGIVFSVMPPKKSWKNIANLSGGEKTLSSLALVFALHHYKPTPLYVMDEIDAALDFRNVSIIANYIKERTRNAQFVIISLRNNMFELADRLVGIYKTDSCTKSVTINPHQMTLVSAN